MEKITLDSITFTEHGTSIQQRVLRINSFDITFRIAFTDKWGSAIHMLCELPCYGDFDTRNKNGDRDINLQKNKAHAKRYLRLLGVSARSIDKAMKR